MSKDMPWHRFTDTFCSLRVLAAGFSSSESLCAASHRIIRRAICDTVCGKSSGAAATLLHSIVYLPSCNASVWSRPRGFYRAG
jgi:hypothetical protein